MDRVRGRVVKKVFLFAVFMLIAVMSTDAWAPLFLSNPDNRAFVLSDDFWLMVFFVVFVIGFAAAISFVVLKFHPGSLPGRTEREGRE